MASSNASVGAPSRNTSHENVVPLESIFTGEPSGPPNHRPVSAWADPGEIAKHWDILESQRAVLGRLKAWHQWDTDRYESLSTYLMSKAGFPKRPICPTRDELLSLLTYFFPPRRSLKVVVCDFGAYRFERSEIRLEELAQYWQDKPEWATVRWIHLPLGSGRFESYVEQNFRQGKDTEGQYHGFEILDFRNRQYLQDQLDVFNILREYPRLDPGFEQVLLGTFFVEGSRNFWDDVHSDLPWQLDEGIRSDFSKLELGKGSLAPEIGQQLLSRHPLYSDAVLVRDYFRCISRDDGFLLTSSPTAGLNYVGKDFDTEIAIPPNARTMRPHYHALENIRRRWEIGGTTYWPLKSVHWLMVSLIIELEVTPHNHHSWKDVPDIQNAYLPVVRDLKRRRASRFRRHESVNLVREYVSCMDEMSQIHEISVQKIEFLGELREHCKVLDTGLNAAHSRRPLDQQHFLTERVDEAVRQIKKDNENLPRLINDLKASLDVLFQLRTIEQNELAIIAESNNKAILVFTVVTIIFLPLSFFTSYFGMNLQGIANTDKTQGYFWAVCGSITLFVVSFTVVFGFKERLYGWIWANRDYGRARDLKNSNRRRQHAF